MSLVGAAAAALFTYLSSPVYTSSGMVTVTKPTLCIESCASSGWSKAQSGRSTKSSYPCAAPTTGRKNGSCRSALDRLGYLRERRVSV